MGGGKRGDLSLVGSDRNEVCSKKVHGGCRFRELASQVADDRHWGFGFLVLSSVSVSMRRRGARAGIVKRDRVEGLEKHCPAMYVELVLCLCDHLEGV
jgi:hypothetical protein